MSYQFPPSSPVLHDQDSRSDPFSKPVKGGGELNRRGRFEYPTPNPSSTLGRSSSPTRITDDIQQPSNLGEKVPNAVSINRDFNILNPDSQVLRVPLLSFKPTMFVGRSLKLCDFHFRSIDKAVSRIHIKIEHTKDTLDLTCLGYNGFGMILPRMCEVKKMEGKEGHYLLLETKRRLKLLNISKTIRLDYQHTEFHVSRNEVVSMPRFNNVLVQIRDKVILINPDDYEEELTDEESLAVVESNELASKTEEEQPLKIKEQAPEKLPVEQNCTPINKTQIEPQTPKAVSLGITLEEPTPIRAGKQKTPQFSIHEDQFNIEKKDDRESIRTGSQANKAKPPIKRATTPLAEKTNTLPHSPLVKRRAASEEPMNPKKPRNEPARDAEGKLIIDDSCIEGLKDIQEINNILINHLAFSRLSSTPASFLNTILAIVSNLTLEQLRTVLHNVECIGVIYRQGKDAAGKPLEEEYYYIPEKDKDPERTKLVGSIKGHGGLRACRKKHKQYYWKKPAPIKK